MLAGPGSGKTKTLTIKMARLLSEDVNAPRGVACITYSTECARELKQRLERLGVEERGNVFIGTVHGFCFKNVVVPYARLAGMDIPEPLVVPDDERWMAVFERAVRASGISENPAYIKTRMEAYRRTYLDRESRDWRERDEETASLIERFEGLMHSYGYVDFDDMVLMGLKLIKENLWVRKALHARFPILVVDEYQDLGTPLHQIVLNLCFKAGVRILAVGDPDQSIYGFTGANPELLKELAERSSMETITLRMNYRSGRTIVSSSMVALGEERGYAAAGSHDGTITFWECPAGIEEQAQVICSSIIPGAIERQEGRTLGDVAILYIDRNDGAVITQAVKDNGLKYVGGDKEVRYSSTPLTRWLEDCAAWCAGGWRMGIPYLSSLVAFWTAFHEAPYGSDYYRNLRRQLVSFLWEHRDSEQNLKVWLDDLLTLGLGETLEINLVRTDEKKSFESLHAASADPNRLGDLTLGGFGKLRGASDHLNLVTLHSSKGLEFDVVIMMGMEQGRIPSWAASSQESKREPRRLFYVGLTRARYEVHLLYSGWYQNKYGRQFIKGPSEFVAELQERLMSNDN
jgi:DNA helicase II / ATP-dependent DNA helicase PcrA